MKGVVQSLVDRAKRAGVTFADARAVEEFGTNVRRQDRRTDQLSGGTSLGVGIRVLLHGAWGFASTNSLEPSDLQKALDTALEMAKASAVRLGEPGVVAQLGPVEAEVVTDFDVDPRQVSVADKMEVVKRLEDAAADRVGPQLANSTASYSDAVMREVVANTNGTLVDNTIVRTSCSVGVVAVDGEIRQRDWEHRSALGGFEIARDVDLHETSIKAADTALMLLSAAPPPSGRFPVILHPTIVGVFIHEALGHNAEADHILASDSILEGKEGEPIASEFVTVVDDATVPGSWGSYAYDSEGTPGAKRIILDKGILSGYMHSLETAARMGVAPNGSARAQGYSARPIVRMSNTIVEPGPSSLEQLAKEMGEGLVLEGGQWGYVMCAKGQYTCHAGRGRFVKNGQIGQPFRDVTFAGMILDTLRAIDGLTAEFEMLTMGGMCGKNGQGMYVNGGGPYVRVKELVVGGQQGGRGKHGRPTGTGLRGL